LEAEYAAPMGLGICFGFDFYKDVAPDRALTAKSAFSIFKKFCRRVGFSLE
jgi:hypothetical protein